MLIKFPNKEKERIKVGDRVRILLWHLETRLKNKSAMNQTWLKKKIFLRDFPGDLVVKIKTLCFHCRGHGFNPWFEELRSHMLCRMIKKKEKASCTKCRHTSEILWVWLQTTTIKQIL